MEKIKNFFANKKVGYYLVVLNFVLAIFLGIFFYATYKHFEPGYGHQGMASNAYANVPEVIGLFMFLAAAIELVALLLPEFIWIQILALAPICISLMKQIYCIPNLIADEANKVHYQGGSLPLCMSWLIITFVMIIITIVVVFVGMIKQDEEERLKKEKIAGKKLIKVACGAGVAVAALAVVLSVYGITADSIKKGSAGATLAERVKMRLKEFEDKVDTEYTFNPAEFKLTEAENQYAGQSSSAIQNAVGSYSQTQERGDLHKVYIFEGSTAEGWQGDYSQKYVRITLWEDGLYNGTIQGGSLYGYWYNVDEYGEDCLMLMSHDGNNDMVGQKLAGEGSYYEWIVDAKANYNGGRLIKGNGVKYYPLIGMFVDTGSTKTPEYEVGSAFDMSAWTCMQVRNNLVAGSIFDVDNVVKWTYRAKDAAEDDPWNNAPDMSTAGTQIARVRWNVDKFARNAEVDDNGTYYYQVDVEFKVA